MAKVVGPVRVADDLDEAFAVAQVDEDDAAVVAAAVDPAHQRHGLAEVAAVDAAAIVGTVQRILRKAMAVGMMARVRGGQRGRAGAIARAGRLVLPDQFRGAAAASAPTGVAGVAEAAARGAGAMPPIRAPRDGRGATTPIEMMYLSASSTDMSSSRTLAFGIITK